MAGSEVTAPAARNAVEQECKQNATQGAANLPLCIRAAYCSGSRGCRTRLQQYPNPVIVTHTQNAQGQRRIYLGAKSSLECWIEPKDDNRSWSFHLDKAVTGNQLTEADTKTWAIHTLIKLAEALNVRPDDLAGVPFESIAALHSIDPFTGRRVSAGRRATTQGFLSTPPLIRRPSTDFNAAPAATPRQRPR